MIHKTWLLSSLLILGNILLLCFTVVTLERRKLWRLPKRLGPYHVAYPQKYKFIIDQPDKCAQQNPFVVIIVPVAPNNVDARNAIRMTWGSDKLVQEKVALVLFLLGSHYGTDADRLQEQLQTESEQYQDLLQSNFKDTYRNLTIKTMVMMEWLNKKCPQASYGVKVDADVLLSIRNLMSMLVNLNMWQRNYITGLVLFSNSVLRDPSSKFYIPHEVYPKSRYPPYPLGMCYIFSMDLPEKIVRASMHIRPIFIEDAYLGMCLNRLGIRPKTPPNIQQFVVKPPHYNRCFYSKLIAVLTNSPTQLVAYWTDIHTSRTPC
nr:beta-1,3-galactosyltransferase 2-like [Misgurnus anguillicaudatus]